MHDIFTNYTRTLREWLEIDTELQRLGVDTLEEGRVLQGLPAPSLADISLSTESSSIYLVEQK
jgi:hypothetical protein